jgi:hypothetical protein
LKALKCFLCGKRHWSTQPCRAINTPPAINEERLTDAINGTPAIDVAVDGASSGARDTLEHGAPHHMVRGGRTADGRLPMRNLREGGPHKRAAETFRTPNRRKREDYNAYMRDYMRRRRGS